MLKKSGLLKNVLKSLDIGRMNWLNSAPLKCGFMLQGYMGYMPMETTTLDLSL